MPTVPDPEPAPPRFPRVRLGALAEAGLADVVDGDTDLDAVSVAGVRAESLSWTGRRRLGSSRVDDLAAASWSATAASFVDSFLEGLEVTALDAAGSSWWNVTVTASRIGSAELYDSTWRGVRFRRCKLGYLNLRGARLTDVEFADCVITDLDLARASATRVAFPGTRIGRLELTGAKLVDVDLRGAALDDVGDAEGLRGATITTTQLLDLAPALAARLGIRVD